MTTESYALEGAPAMVSYTVIASGGMRFCEDCDTRWAGTPDTQCFICDRPGRAVLGALSL